VSLRVIGPDERLTRPARSMVGAEERARRVALLVGEAEIQQRLRGKEWETIERFTRVNGRVQRMTAW
jgi:hypothetical protein